MSCDRPCGRAPATAAHQVEGGNWNNDWWAWEHDPQAGCREPSGDACDHYHRYPDDIALLASFGLNAYRFSLEWSRIEPEEGEWSKGALDHYRRMCAACRDNGLLPVVTFHHFTTPRWLAQRGGWEHPEAAVAFARFCGLAAAALGEEMGIACTINEPNIVAVMGYLWGVFPPGVRDSARRRAVDAVLLDAHRRGRDAIREAAPSTPVGLTLSMTDYQPLPGGEARVTRIRGQMEDIYLEATDGDDFVGVQAYTRMRIAADRTLAGAQGVPVTQMGYELWPAALEATIRRAAQVTGGRPVLVTENGVATDDDGQRIAYLHAALAGVERCVAEGIDVRGYFHWSALDNFEWALGYEPLFGLIAVDRRTLRRVPRPSAHWLGACARSRQLQAVPGRP